jgi:hypothetical protein
MVDGKNTPKPAAGFLSTKALPPEADLVIRLQFRQNRPCCLWVLKCVDKI